MLLKLRGSKSTDFLTEPKTIALKACEWTPGGYKQSNLAPHLTPPETVLPGSPMEHVKGTRDTYQHTARIILFTSGH